LVAGTGLVITFSPRTSGDPIAGIVSVQEGRFVDGRWVVSRWLSGDETHQGRHLRIPAGQFGIQRIKLYRYR
jgi:beta-galactosidase GanA